MDEFVLIMQTQTTKTQQLVDNCDKELRKSQIKVRKVQDDVEAKFLAFKEEAEESMFQVNKNLGLIGEEKVRDRQLLD